MSTSKMPNSPMRQLLSIFLLVTTLLLPACKQERQPDLGSRSFVYLDQLNYNLGARGTTLTLRTNHPSDHERRIAYRISGEAVRGVDFQLSDSAFILPAGATEAKVTLTRLTEGDHSRSFQLALLPATDGSYEVSLKSFSIVQVLSKAVYRQGFARATGRLLSETSFNVALTRNPSGRYRVDEATHLTLEVAPSSTAVEGVHFAFPQGREVVVPRREQTAPFKVRFLKKEEGHDKLVLRLAEIDGFTDGRNATLTLAIQGPEDFSGTWKLRALANAADLEGYGIIPTQLFTADPADQLRLTKTATGYQVDASFVSNLKNYFPASVAATVTGEASISPDGNPSGAEPYGELTLPDVLTNFDPSKPERRPAKIYFRLVTTSAGTELELLINDYKTSAPSWQDLYSYGMGSTDAPLVLRFTPVLP